MSRYRTLAGVGEQSLVLVADAGDELVDALRRLAAAEQLRSSHIQAVGGFASVRLGFFDVDTKQYVEIHVGEQVEILSLLGDVTDDGKGGAQIHVHVVVGCRDGRALGGHLLAGTVRPTCEVFVTETPAPLTRRHDPDTGLALIDSEGAAWTTLASDAG